MEVHFHRFGSGMHTRGVVESRLWIGSDRCCDGRVKVPDDISTRHVRRRNFQAPSPSSATSSPNVHEDNRTTWRGGTLSSCEVFECPLCAERENHDTISEADTERDDRDGEPGAAAGAGGIAELEVKLASGHAVDIFGVPDWFVPPMPFLFVSAQPG